MKMREDAFEALFLLFKENELLDPAGAEQKATVGQPDPIHPRREPLTYRRFIWNRLWRIPHNLRDEWFSAHGIYRYLDDTHIETALRRIFPPAEPS
jgi:hypothetical protein